MASTCTIRNNQDFYTEKIGKIKIYELKQGDIIDIYSPEEWKNILGDAIYQLVTRYNWVLQIGYDKEHEKAWIEMHHQQGKSENPLKDIHPKEIPTQRTEYKYKRKK